MQTDQSASSTGPEERRKSPRIVLATQVECRVGHDSTLGHSCDISEGGLLVATTDTLESQTEVVVRVNLPSYVPDTLIEAAGVIVWVRPAESMGVQFTQPTGRQRDAIAKFIQNASGRER